MSDKEQRIIIFDGPDRCGKTTIAQELSRRLDIPYFKYKGETKAFATDPSHFMNVMKFAEPYFIDYLQDSNTSIIIDRGYPSEWIYSQIFGRQTDMDALFNVDRGFSNLKTKILIPFRSEYIQGDDRFKTITPERLAEIDQMCMKFIKWSSCETLRFCVDDEDLEREIEEIYSFLGVT